MAILLALVAALAYGLSDFAGGVFSRRSSAWTIAFVASLSGAVFVSGLAILLGGSPERSDLAWAVLAGLGNGVGTVFLYRGLGSGRMGVVSPVSGVGAALLPVVVGVGTGERPSAVVWSGIVVALPAIWLVARTPPGPEIGGRSLRSNGFLDGALAGLGFGSLFVALAQIPEEAGFAPLALNQLVAGIVIALVAVAARQPWLPRDRAAANGALCGLLGAVATVAFLVAIQGGYLTVTAVITSLYPGFTVLLAYSVLREHVHRGQALGLALGGLAVGLVAAG